MNTSHIPHSLFLICVLILSRVCVRVLCVRDTCNDLQSAFSVCACVCVFCLRTPFLPGCTLIFVRIWSNWKKQQKNQNESRRHTHTCTYQCTNMHMHTHAQEAAGTPTSASASAAASHPWRGSSDGSSSSWKRKLLLQESSAAGERAERELIRVQSREREREIECRRCCRVHWVNERAHCALSANVRKDENELR